MTAAIFARIKSVRRHAASSGWAMAEYVAYPLMMFAATPLFLAALGAAQYGQWMLLITFTGFGGLAGFGMGPAATKEVSAARGRGDLADAADGARACLAVALLGALALSAVLVAIGLGPGAGWLARMGTPERVAAIVLFAAALIALEQLDSVFAGVLRGFERFDLSARIEVSAKLVLVLATAAVAWFTRDLLAVFATATLVTVVRALVKRAAARRLIGAALVPRWSRPHVRQAFGFGGWVWVQSIGSMLFAVADRLLIGALLGAEPLARYAIALQLAQQVQTIPAAGAQVLLPTVAQRAAAGQDYRRLAIRATLALSAVALAGALALVIVGRPLLALWVGERMAAGVWPTLPWLAAAYALLALPTAAHYVRLGSGGERFVAVVTIIAGASAFAAAWILTPTYGLIGASAARIVYGLIALSLLNVIAFDPSRRQAAPPTIDS